MTGYAVHATHERYRGPIFSVVTDEVELPDGSRVNRDYTRNLGAVGVVALDHADQVILVHQYRHPLCQPMWELPAGLADVTGEALELTAARELAEEADLVAAQWRHLLDLHTSPGLSDERMRLFLARELSDVPMAERHQREHEEAEMIMSRVRLDTAVAMALRGEITNGPTVAGLLAAAHVRDRGWPDPA